MKARFLKDAETDFHAAIRWCERQRRGLGADFTDEVFNALDRIEADPASLPVEETNPSARDVRRCNVKRFPYRIIYAVRSNVIAVLAVAHHSRQSGYWIRRR